MTTGHNINSATPSSISSTPSSLAMEPRRQPLPRTLIKRQSQYSQPHSQAQYDFAPSASHYASPSSSSSTSTAATTPSKHTSLKFRLNQRRAANTTSPSSVPTSTSTSSNGSQTSLPSTPYKNNIRLNLTPKKSLTPTGHDEFPRFGSSSSSSPPSPSPAPKNNIRLKLNNPKTWSAYPSPSAAVPTPTFPPSHTRAPQNNASYRSTSTFPSQPQTLETQLLQALQAEERPSIAPCAAGYATDTDASSDSSYGFDFPDTDLDLWESDDEPYIHPSPPYFPTSQDLPAFRKAAAQELAESRASLEMCQMQMRWAHMGGVPVEDLEGLQRAMEGLERGVRDGEKRVERLVMRERELEMKEEERVKGLCGGEMPRGEGERGGRLQVFGKKQKRSKAKRVERMALLQE